MNYVQDNMFLGQLPKRLVIACVDIDALNGAIVGCEIKSKQGVSFGIIFSRNGISFVLIHFSGTGVESHITSDVAIVFEVGL
jgi:hypothetical protein